MQLASQWRWKSRARSAADHALMAVLYIIAAGQAADDVALALEAQAWAASRRPASAHQQSRWQHAAFNMVEQATLAQLIAATATRTFAYYAEVRTADATSAESQQQDY